MQQASFVTPDLPSRDIDSTEQKSSGCGPEKYCVQIAFSFLSGLLIAQARS